MRAGVGGFCMARSRSSLHRSASIACCRPSRTRAFPDPITQVGASAAVLTPAFPLPVGTYRLVATDRIRDLAGNALANPAAGDFVVLP